MLDPRSPARSETSSILLVEDDEQDAALIRQCLSDAGINGGTVAWACTLRDALPMVSSRLRCVLLDLDLPDTDGLAALNAMIEAAVDTPVIVLTGRHEQTGVEALAAGAQDYLIKDDISPDQLGRSIRYAVERKRAQITRQQLRDARVSSAEKARLERGLLPTPLLRTDAVDCATYYQPGRDHAVLGGDFFDVVETADGRVRAVIGDVMGHGPDEAALGVHLRVAWRALVLAGAPDTEILPSLATLLSAESAGESIFVTACDVTIAPDATARIRVAGHPAPLLCADGKTRYLDLEVGPPLGVEVADAKERWAATGGWPQTQVAVGGGSSLILYTDGLLDAYASEATLGIGEIVDAVASVADKGGLVSSWIPTLVGSGTSDALDDTAVVVLTLRPPESD